jgi:BMFP domain-containing protein YqiC
MSGQGVSREKWIIVANLMEKCDERLTDLEERVTTLECVVARLKGKKA